LRCCRVAGFLANKYAAAKRFGLEGCETLIPGMKAMIDRSAEGGVENICIGMPHRGVCSSVQAVSL
jgi:2-oxoglutarate dehydrogenase E1 component